MGLFEKRSDGSGEAERLLSPGDIGGVYAVPGSSVDGALTFYVGTRDGPRDLWFWPKDGGPRALLKTAFDDRAPGLSPDGQWVTYVSDQSGQDEVYVQPVDGGTRHCVGGWWHRAGMVPRRS